MDVCNVLIHLAFPLFAAIRTYAIWQKDRRIFFCVLVPGLIFPAGYIFRATQATYFANLPSPLTGCSQFETLPADVTPGTFGAGNLYFMLGAGSTLLFECITIALTWIKTISAVRQLRRYDAGISLPVSYVIFYDGTLQFIAILVMNCLCFLELVWAPLNYLFDFSDILTSLIVSRFILDLREDYLSRTHLDGEASLYHVSDVSSVRFGGGVVSSSINSSMTLQVQPVRVTDSLQDEVSYY